MVVVVVMVVMVVRERYQKQSIKQTSKDVSEYQIRNKNASKTKRSYCCMETQEEAAKAARKKERTTERKKDKDRNKERKNARNT